MKRYIIFSIITLFTCLVTKAQIIVTGTVVDAENEPLIGVNILEEGTTNGNITDINGRYSITVANANSKLSYSYISYKTVTQAVGNRKVIRDSREID